MIGCRTLSQAKNGSDGHGRHVTIEPKRYCRTRLVWIAIGLAAAGGCSTYIGTTSTSFLGQVRNSTDPNIRYAAYAKLAVPGIYEDQAHKAEAVSTLIAKYQEGKEPVAIRAVIIRGLGALGDPRGRAVVIKAANDPEAVIRVEAVERSARSGSPKMPPFSPGS